MFTQHLNGFKYLLTLIILFNINNDPKEKIELFYMTYKWETLMNSVKMRERESVGKCDCSLNSTSSSESQMVEIEIWI